MSVKRSLLGGMLTLLTGAAHSVALPTCPFSAAELTAQFGVAFADGVADKDYPATGMLTRICHYQAKDYTLMVLTTLFDKPEDAINAKHMLIGKLQAVPNDPDSAVLQLEQSNANNPAIFYVRQGVAVDLRILGSYYKNTAVQAKALKTMQENLLQLRRLP